MSDSKNVVHGVSPPVRVVGGQTNFETMDKILDEASAIMKKVNESGVRKEDDKGNEFLLSKLQNEHRDFATSFPIPLRWMVQMRQYDKKAFSKFLVYYRKVVTETSTRTSVFATRKQFIEVQAEYIVYLKKAMTPRCDRSVILRTRENVIKLLTEESDEFEKVQKEVAEELKKDEASADKRRRDDLFNALTLALEKSRTTAGSTKD